MQKNKQKFIEDLCYRYYIDLEKLLEDAKSFDLTVEEKDLLLDKIIIQLIKHSHHTILTPSFKNKSGFIYLKEVIKELIKHEKKIFMILNIWVKNLI